MADIQDAKLRVHADLARAWFISAFGAFFVLAAILCGIANWPAELSHDWWVVALAGLALEGYGIRNIQVALKHRRMAKALGQPSP